MNGVRKRIVTDEQMRPVGVLIDYADWLRIEKLLANASPSEQETDLSPFAGTLTWGEDGVAYQRRAREEWER